ncbi:MAG: hypothetical protein J6P20_07185, partial [Oscillospiraceae bacterium]|nr:hypothetical protein [Oscillospiraceae bacterium]
ITEVSGYDKSNVCLPRQHLNIIFKSTYLRAIRKGEIAFTIVLPFLTRTCIIISGISCLEVPLYFYE